ncbi:hypothetical protein AURDEDRAFT_186693 [Auricularia subglabra TFB-10046 SS5]|nr:hypothetical protein AURDEDRAFT_186693 [Auricularia subglabra TFB-10046 SS5]
MSTYGVKEGPGIFSPKDNLELPRAGPVRPSAAEDLFLVSVSTFSFDAKAQVSTPLVAMPGLMSAVDVPLLSPGEVFWLDDRTIVQVMPKDAEAQQLVARAVDVAPGRLTVAERSPLGDMPAGAVNFTYKLEGGVLVFSAGVYDEYDLSKVEQHDDDWNKRGHSALVYDRTFMRCIDTWRTPKRSSLFSVALQKSATGWHLGSAYRAVLKGTGHHVPSEPYGGTEDFAVSSTAIAYTVKDPDLPEAWHIKQNVYLVDIEGKSPPRELTSGKHGATLSPGFSRTGDKVAWLEQAVDGDEASKTYVVIFDLTNGSRTEVGVDWDRSPNSFAFSPADNVLYLTAPTRAAASSALAPLADGRLLFMRSSFAAPSDVFALDGAEERRLTDFYGDALAGRAMGTPREIFWTGATRTVQGWVFLPAGFARGEARRWPALMMTHGAVAGRLFPAVQPERVREPGLRALRAELDGQHVLRPGVHRRHRPRLGRRAVRRHARRLGRVPPVVPQGRPRAHGGLGRELGWIRDQLDCRPSGVWFRLQGPCKQVRNLRLDGVWVCADPITPASVGARRIPLLSITEP